MQGCFEVKNDENSEFDVNCGVIGKYSENGIPDEQMQLYKNIESTSSIIKSLDRTDKEIKKDYFGKLISLAQVGLAGPNAQPLLAMNSLNALKHDILIKESGRIKNKYMILLGEWALSLIVINIIVSGYLHKFDIYTLDRYIYTFIGAMIGTWISFGARKVELNFDDLSIIEKDRLNPIIRLIFVGITSGILMLFISSGIIEFSIGGLGSKEIMDSIELQVLIGIIAGLIEYKLAVGIFNKANDMIKI